MSVKRDEVKPIVKKSTQGLADKVKAGLPEFQYPGAKTMVCRKSAETCNLESTVTANHGDQKTPTQEHISMRDGKDTNGTPKSA